MLSRVALTYWGMARLSGAAMVLCRARWQVVDPHLMPRTGPFIMVVNHLGFADPAILVASAPRRMSFIAKEELLHGRGSAFILWAMGGRTIRRGQPDRAALRTALDALRNGEALAIFPEGTRSLSHSLQRGQPGAALLAQWSGVPLVPAAIWGSETIRLPGSIFARPAITVRFGEPFTLPKDQAGTRVSLTAATETIMHGIAALLPESYRGVYSESNAAGGLQESQSRVVAT